MIRKFKKKIKNTIYIFLLLSLFVHLSFLISFMVAKPTPVPPRVTQVEVEYVEPKVAPPANAPAQKVVKNNNLDQIVEQKDRVNEEVDKNTKYLSAFNQKVIKETRAERSGKFTNTAKGGKPSDGRKDADKKNTNVSEEIEKPLDPGEMPELKNLAPKFSMDPGPKAPDAKNDGDPSQSDDYLKDVNTGMQTLLSTREFVYYSYYNRIKEAIRQHWEPNVREKVKIIYRQGRSIASSKDRVTQVLVTLNAKGELLKVEVLTQSGLEQLDGAAVEAFRAASPFPNPPKGMVESDGTIKIRWDFVLEV